MDIPTEPVDLARHILIIRRQSVMLDADSLASQNVIPPPQPTRQIGFKP